MGSIEPKRPALAWGIFLGVSWTWCIGMFLPVLLVRDLGPASFLVFALPNVIGAAGMGWVLERHGLSEAWVAQNRPACVAFSVVTILFHIFFAGWVISLLLGAVGGVLAILLAAVLWTLGRTRPGRDVTAAMVVYLLSLACIALFLQFGHIALPPVAYRLDNATIRAAFLIPVCFFGFGLCPYLDLTFHRARQAVSPTAAKLAFSTGFGLFFLSMILFTLAYSGVVARRLTGATAGVAGIIVGAHLLTQSAYTLAAHLREVMDTRPRDGLRLGIFTAAAIGIVLSVAWLTSGQPWTGELPYFLFLAFYGLVFPTYVWAVLIGRGKVDVRVLTVGIVLAAPCYYVGFVNRQTAWLLPGVAIAVVAGLVSTKTRRTAMA